MFGEYYDNENPELVARFVLVYLLDEKIANSTRLWQHRWLVYRLLVCSVITKRSRQNQHIFAAKKVEDLISIIIFPLHFSIGKYLQL